MALRILALRTVGGAVDRIDTAIGRADIHVVEPAQEIGRTAADRTTFNADNAAGAGVLWMIAHPDPQRGALVPFVRERAAGSADATRGGASAAPSKDGHTATTNGISLTAVAAKDSGRTWSATVAVDSAWTPPTTATVLRENERIAAADGTTFALSSTGVLTRDRVARAPTAAGRRAGRRPGEHPP